MIKTSSGGAKKRYSWKLKFNFNWQDTLGKKCKGEDFWNKPLIVWHCDFFCARFMIFLVVGIESKTEVYAKNLTSRMIFTFYFFYFFCQKMPLSFLFPKPAHKIKNAYKQLLMERWCKTLPLQFLSKLVFFWLFWAAEKETDFKFHWNWTLKMGKLILNR